MIITGTLISYYLFCERRCWLFANGIRMEDFSEAVYEGKLVGETTYLQRPDKYSEVAFSAQWNGMEITCKIDDYEVKKKIIHEVKKSDSHDYTHELQVKFYIWILELNGIQGVTAILEYPILRKTDEVVLSEEDREFLKETILKIRTLMDSENCPPVINAKSCKNCSYYEFCYIDEP